MFELRTKVNKTLRHFLKRHFLLWPGDKKCGYAQRGHGPCNLALLKALHYWTADRSRTSGPITGSLRDDGTTAKHSVSGVITVKTILCENIAVLVMSLKENSLVIFDFKTSTVKISINFKLQGQWKRCTDCTKHEIRTFATLVLVCTIFLVQHSSKYHTFFPCIDHFPKK